MSGTVRPAPPVQPVRTEPASLLVRLSKARSGGRHDSVLIHPAGGGLLQYLPLVPLLATWGSVSGIRAAGLVPGEDPHCDVPAMAAAYTEAILTLQRPPAVLLGWSMGGVLAWEVSALLAEYGVRPVVVMIDSMCDPEVDPVTSGQAGTDPLDDWTATILSHGVGSDAHNPNSVATTRAHVIASMAHQVRTVSATPALLLACGSEPAPAERLGNWAALAPELRIDRLPGGHFDVFDDTVRPLMLDRIERFLSALWTDHE